MKESSVTGTKRDEALDGLRKSPLFSALKPKELEIVLTHCLWVSYDAQEAIVEEGSAADDFYLLLTGEADILVAHESLDETVEVGRISAVCVLGEMALLLGHPRSATVLATEAVTALRFTKAAFQMMMDGIPEFARRLCVELAERLAQTTRRVPLPQLNLDDLGLVEPATMQLLPAPFLMRHRLLPVSMKDGVLKIGFVDDPTSKVVGAIRRMLPNVQLQPFRLSNDAFEEALRTHGFSENFLSGQPEPPVVVGVVAGEPIDPLAPLSPDEIKARVAKLQPLLQRMVAEGASDLHMCAGHKPRWRIDGDLYTIEDCRPLSHNEVEDLLSAMMPLNSRKDFLENLQADFSYTMPGAGRFRVNLYHDEHGTSAVLRHIPTTIPSTQQLELPSAMRAMMQMNQGLILITGPTGSGKSTTLAALIEEINQNHLKHIITLEDPIEFVYESKKSLINQRQIGTHARSFSMGLRGALREDPDIVLVGEMRDMETMMLAIETANTGHLVLGTLHTRDTISAVERIIDLFPADLQGQVRSSLSDLLKGVLSQVLCKRKGGGRVAAFELLTINQAAANLIRQSKTHQLTTVLTTQKPNKSLNAHLEELVRQQAIDINEAFNRSNDKDDMKSRLGRAAESPARPSYTGGGSLSSSQLPAAAPPNAKPQGLDRLKKSS